MRDYRKIIFLLIVALFLLQMYVMKQDEKIGNGQIQKPMVAVSTFSLYDITKHISANTLQIVNIIPFGVDPHSYEPTPKSMVNISKSKLVLFSGAGLEPWTNGFDFKNKVVDISRHIKLRELDEDEHEHHEFHDDQCEHNTIDPHYWLDFSNMAIATNLITEELIKISPSNKSLVKTPSLSAGSWRIGRMHRGRVNNHTQGGLILLRGLLQLHRMRGA